MKEKDQRIAKAEENLENFHILKNWIEVAVKTGTQVEAIYQYLIEPNLRGKRNKNGSL